MNKSYTVKNTLGMFDLFKGLVMITMIVGHTYGIFEGIENNYPKMIFFAILNIVGTAAMPALFLISGYGFRKTTFKKCVKRQFKTLIIPYLICLCLTTVIHLIGYYLLYGGAIESVKKTILTFLGGAIGVGQSVELAGHFVPAVGPTWFMLALAIGGVIFNQLLNRFKERKLMFAVAIVALLGWALTRYAVMPWTISQGMIANLYLFIGYYSKKKKLLIQNNNKKMVFASIGVLVAGGIVAGFGSEFNMAYSLYPLGPVSIFLVGALAFVDIYWFLRINRFNGRIIQFIRSLGRYSLYFLCIHAIEVASIGRYLQGDFVNNWTGALWLRNWLLFGTRFVFITILTFVFVKIKDKYFNSEKLDIQEGIWNLSLKTLRPLLKMWQTFQPMK